MFHVKRDAALRPHARRGQAASEHGGDADDGWPPSSLPDDRGQHARASDHEWGRRAVDAAGWRPSGLSDAPSPCLKRAGRAGVRCVPAIGPAPRGSGTSRTAALTDPSSTTPPPTTLPGDRTGCARRSEGGRRRYGPPLPRPRARSLSTAPEPVTGECKYGSVDNAPAVVWMNPEAHTGPRPTTPASCALQCIHKPVSLGIRERRAPIPSTSSC